MIYVLALISIILGAIAQYLLKVGMNAIPLDSGKGIAFILKEAVTNIPLLGGLTCYGLSMIFWLYVLSQMELKQGLSDGKFRVCLRYAAGIFPVGRISKCI